MPAARGPPNLRGTDRLGVGGAAAPRPTRPDQPRDRSCPGPAQGTCVRRADDERTERRDRRLTWSPSPPPMFAVPESQPNVKCSPENPDLSTNKPVEPPRVGTRL